MTMDPHVRVSDADREQAAQTLRRHAAAGRLTPDEFSERCARAYAAVTAGELAVLCSDLPHDEEPQAPVPQGPTMGIRRGWVLGAFAVAALAGAVVVGGFTDMAAAAGSMMDGGCH